MNDPVIYLIALPIASFVAAFIFMGIIKIACGFYPGYWHTWFAFVVSIIPPLIVGMLLISAYGYSDEHLVTLFALVSQTICFAKMIRRNGEPIGAINALIILSVQFLVLILLSGFVLAIPQLSMGSRVMFVGMSIVSYFLLYKIATRKSLRTQNLLDNKGIS